MSDVIPFTTSLQTERKRFGQTQRAVARLLGCSEHTIIRYERGHAVPDLATALKLQLLYQVPLKKLFPALYDTVRQEVASVLPPAPSAAVSTTKPVDNRRSPRVLAIDPSSKALGIAVVEQDKLLYSGVRYLPDRPLPDRLLRDGVQIVRDLIQRYQPQTIVVPMTTYVGCTRSRHVRMFCWRLHKLASQKQLRFVECGPDQIRRVFPNHTKHEQALAIAELFPDLRAHLPAERRPWEPQNPHMQQFSGIALALAGRNCRRR